TGAAHMAAKTTVETTQAGRVIPGATARGPKTSRCKPSSVTATDASASGAKGTEYPAGLRPVCVGDFAASSVLPKSVVK
ncbi:MAG: hypothetical protein J4N64_05535, partial [Chloroflexi bacterium]|nr:hypothetical protein [Chloroflexota bacterium]